MNYRRCLRYWRLAIFTPILYLLICLFVQHRFFSHRETSGFWPLPEKVYQTIWILLLAGCALIIPLILWLKSNGWLQTAPGNHTHNSEEQPHRLMMRYTFLLALCDLIAAFGCILFLLQGEINVMLNFGFCAMAAYAAIHPSASSKDEGPPE